MKRDPAARKRWHEIYSELSAEKDGLAAVLCGRAEAQTMRLSMLFALLDESEEIRLEHLNAGLAAWRYCEASTTYIFGDSLGDSTADELAEALKHSPDGMSQNELTDLFGRHKTASEINRALGVLQRAGKVHCTTTPTAGRSRKVWQWVR